MYTHCPECETIFHLTVADLRQAGGRVRCGECAHVFYGMDFLEEDPDESTEQPAVDRQPTDQQEIAETEYFENNPPMPEQEDDVKPDTSEILFVSDDDAIEKTDAGDIDSYADEEDEFDEDELDKQDEFEIEGIAPESNDEDRHEIDSTIWDEIPGVGSITEDEPNVDLSGSDADDSGVFLNDSGTHILLDDATDIESAPPDLATIDSGDTGLEQKADEAIAIADSTLGFNNAKENCSPAFTTDTIGEIKTDEIRPLIMESVETETFESQDVESPPWQFKKYSNIDLSRYNHLSGSLLFGTLTLALLFSAQLIHYNRDSLAAHPKYGAKIRDLYATLGQPVYPAWSIKNYEIRGSEAVVGETGANVMDIRTQIAAIGDDPVGLPLLRVTLSDRWSNPVAARHFNPEEYATEALPSDNLLIPNNSIDAHLSIIDPGSGAQGYELELCIPHRNNQLQCSGNAFK